VNVYPQTLSQYIWLVGFLAITELLLPNVQVFFVGDHARWEYANVWVVAQLYLLSPVELIYDFGGALATDFIKNETLPHIHPFIRNHVPFTLTRLGLLQWLGELIGGQY